jgi:hypothetical protein
MPKLRPIIICGRIIWTKILSPPMDLYFQKEGCSLFVSGRSDITVSEHPLSEKFLNGL